jgi:hypothetical protein
MHVQDGSNINIKDTLSEDEAGMAHMAAALEEVRYERR